MPDMRIHRLLQVSALTGVLVLIAAGCSSPEHDAAEQPATSPEKAAASALGPKLAYADVQLVPGIGEWVREPIDDSRDAALTTAYVDSADNAVVIELRDYLNGSVTYDVGFIPAYWDEATDLSTHDNGFTCATLYTGPSCYRLLTDGILEIDCNEGPCSKTPDELSDISALFYTAFSGGSTAGGTTEEEEICGGLDLADVDEAFASWASDAGAALDLEESIAGEYYTCYVTFPPGSFGEDSAGLMVQRHPYTSATLMTATAGDCDFGGTEPDEVFSSALTCKQQIDATDDYSAGVQSFPGDSAGGTVVSQNEAVRAEPGEYWWEVALTSVTFDAQYSDALNTLAATLP